MGVSVGVWSWEWVGLGWSRLEMGIGRRDASKLKTHLSPAHTNKTQEGQAKEALKAVHRGATLEQRALSAMIYLRIDRPDHVRPLFCFFVGLVNLLWVVWFDRFDLTS